MGKGILVAGLTVISMAAFFAACGSEAGTANVPLDAATDAPPSSSSSGDGGGSGGVVTPEQAAFVDQFCALFAPCCPVYDYEVDEARCRKTMLTVESDIVFVPAKGDECIAQLTADVADRAAFCAGPYFPAACNDVYKRATAGIAGEACKTSEDCKSPTTGDVECHKSGGTDGICQVRVDGKQGDPCDLTDRDYLGNEPTPPKPTVTSCPSKDGLFCETSTRTCQQRRAVSGACTYDVDCVDTARCSGSTCVARSDVGGACNANDAASCLEALYCEKATNTCAAPKADGQPCDQFDECDGKCESGTCVARGPVANIVYLLYCKLPGDGGT